MALEDLISQFNASILVASERANLALSPSTLQDLGLVAKCAAQASSNLSVATQFKIDLESLLIESESNLSAAINKGENVSTLDYLKAELNSTQSADQKANAELRAATTNVELAHKLVEALLANIGGVVELPKKLLPTSQSTLKAFQENDQTTYSFSQLEKFAEALQQIAAQAESSAEQDNILKSSLHLRGQNTTTPEPIKTINGASLSTVADQYIIINGNSPSITINGQPPSKTNPGSGWEAIAVAPSKSDTLFERLVAWHTCSAT